MYLEMHVTNNIWNWDNMDNEVVLWNKMYYIRFTKEGVEHRRTSWQIFCDLNR